MVVTAIIAVLAAVAIPVVYDMQLRSKWAEVPVITEGLADMMLGAENDLCSGLMLNPRYDKPSKKPGKGLRPLDSLVAGDCGFVPDGMLRGTYQAGGSYNRLVWCDEGLGTYSELQSPEHSFHATGMTDLDGDGVVSTWVVLGTPDLRLAFEHCDPAHWPAGASGGGSSGGGDEF